MLLPFIFPGDYDPDAFGLLEGLVLKHSFLDVPDTIDLSKDEAEKMFLSLSSFFHHILEPYKRGSVDSWRKNSLLLPLDEVLDLPLAESTWMYLPLSYYYRLLQEGKGAEEALSPPSQLVRATLFFLLILERIPSVMQHIPRAVKIHELMKVFLLSSGTLLFDVAIATPLDALLRLYYPRVLITENGQAEMEPLAFEKIPGFNAFFSQLVHQFTSVSFGHPLFVRVLWLLLDMRQSSPQYRILLWTELLDSLHFLHLPVEELPLGMHRYLYPVESNPEMLRLYELALCRLSHERSPVLYKIAVHHLSSHLFAPHPHSLRWERVLLLQRLVEEAPQTIRDLCLYKACEKDQEDPGHQCLPRQVGDLQPHALELLQMAASRECLLELSLL